ncbi:uncharacterized protein N7518_002786 [Penicillium psychrosexuale]|uniref:uncharacterized protein n=1 Tax=Penicillium psychrosexuale TaxID=1002107 RepID=UPI002544D630|nr:uncharacterized protein N7518_002786 [Penicillium psychrosexuale]KAJ5800718.1 hypothetical protein N7518_002786 [Penicillium psychrosexuale]
MGSNELNIPTRGMKRSASASEEPLGNEVALPATPHYHSSFPFPYTHYAMIYLDNESKLKYYESQSIQEQDAIVFTSEVCQNFLDILGKPLSYHQPAHQEMDLSFRRLRHRKRKASAKSAFKKPLDKQDSEKPFTGSTELVPLRIGHQRKVMDYYEGALGYFQQLNCRVIAKAFIRFIEPGKHIKHPYNRGKPPPGSPPGTKGDPEKTKPKWWPYTVIHREPDHLRKGDRIKLLVHIIRELGGRKITADKLKEVAGDTKRNLEHPSDVKIIYEILRVRKTEERFERSEVSADKVEYVTYYNPSPTDDDEDEEEEKDYFAEAASAAAGEPLPSKQELAALTTTIEPLHPTPVYSLLGSLSMPNPLNFGVSGLRNNPYYNVVPQYTNAYPMLGTPMASNMTNSQDTPVFEYSIQNPILASTSVHDQTRDPGYYGRRVNTDSDQDVSNRADYSSPETGQRVPPHPMQYHRYIARAHLHHNHSQIPGAL